MSPLRAERLHRLAVAVEARRQELGLTQGALGSHGGPGVVTVGKIERGEIRQPQPSTLSALDRSLRWTTGSAAGILAGRDPVPLPDGEVDHRAVFIAMIRSDPHLLPEAKEHLEKQYALLLRIAASEANPTHEESVARTEATKTSLARLSEVRDKVPTSPTSRRKNSPRK